jgi:hypothetical protein
MSEPAGTSPGIVPNDVFLKLAQPVWDAVADPWVELGHDSTESKQFDSEDGSDVVPEEV